MIAFFALCDEVLTNPATADYKSCKDILERFDERLKTFDVPGFEVKYMRPLVGSRRLL